MVVPGCFVGDAVHFFVFAAFANWGSVKDRSLQLGRSLHIVFVFLFILVWARHGCRATIWRAVLATAC